MGIGSLNIRMGQVITTILIIFYIVQTVSGDRSTEGLVSLAKMERHIYGVIQTHSDTQQSPLVKEYLSDWSESSLNIFQDLNQSDHQTCALKIGKNPIMSYRMVRRYARILRPLYKELPTTVKEDILKKMGKGVMEVDMLSEWPSCIDLDEAMDALLRIHHVYNVNLEEFTSGNIMGTETEVGLTGQQCLEIGEFALGLNRFTSAILWLETALIKAKRSKDLGLTDKIFMTIQLATESHDVGWKDKRQRDYFYFHQKLNETGQEKRVSVREVEYEKRKWKLYELFDCDVRVWGLCSDENYQTNEEIAQLFCWYEMKKNGVRGISPLKIEQLSKSPYLVQIHDVLTNQTIDSFKREGIPLMRKTPRWNLNFVPSFSDSYTGHLAPSVLTRSLSRRIELMTGLSVTPPGAAENFKIKGYAPGGEDACHLDSTPHHADQNDRLGNKLATVLFYLEDADMGGYTGFPAIGVSVKPIRGSAVFWYNMLMNGRPDVRVEHVGCPVVIGQKLIAIKSIRENAQIRTRPCALSKDE